MIYVWCHPKKKILRKNLTFQGPLKVKIGQNVSRKNGHVTNLTTFSTHHGTPTTGNGKGPPQEKDLIDDLKKPGPEAVSIEIFQGGKNAQIFPEKSVKQADKPKQKGGLKTIRQRFLFRFGG